MDQVATALGILMAIIAIGSIVVGLVAFALMRRLDERKDVQTLAVLKLTEKERDLYKGIALRVPAMETELRVLQEQVSGAAAVARLEGKVVTELARIHERIAASDERTSRADAWQAAANKALVEGVNTLLNLQHQPSVQVELPEGDRRAAAWE